MKAKRNVAVFALDDLVLVRRADSAKAWATGDVVELNSGGPPMLVTCVDGDVRCAYDAGDSVGVVAFPAVCLSRSSQPLPERVKREALS